MGLDMLFVTSGFLVTASLLGRQNLIAYLWARILRVYPGMWVMLVLTVFVLAPALTTLPRGDYYTSPLTWEYFRKCATLIGGVRYSLPGVFETVPLEGEFNGALSAARPIRGVALTFLASARGSLCFKCGSSRPHQMTGSCLSETLSTISWAAATPTL